jgi:phosphate transport system substrate-binding protein
MRKNLLASLFVLMAALLVLSACGPAVAPTEESVVVEPTQVPATDVPTAVPTVDPMAMYMPDAVTGDIIAAGSSTVFPLSERMKQRFEEEGFTGNLTIDSIGSGAGFTRFCVDGDIDIANASRKIKTGDDSETAKCQAIGREPIAFRVGTDAIAVVVSTENTFLSDVTLAELALIFSTAEKWSDVRPEWPAEPILRFIPGTDSGTFDYFVEKVMAPANPGDDGKANVEKGEAAILAASNLQLSEDDNVLVQGVEGSPYAIGFFGFAYYQENASKLNVLSIEGVAPTAQTAEDNTYPLSRPLFMYSTASILQEKPQVAAFIYFYLTHVNDEIVDVGYFPASQAALDEALNAWRTAVGK